MWTPRRRYRAELMDRDDNPAEVIERALLDIEKVNRWLGGEKNLLQAFDPYLQAVEPEGCLRVLDVGTGGGHLPLALVERGRRLSRSVHVTAVDRDPATVDVARRVTAHCAAVEVIAADAFALPFDPGSFDVVTASLFLHHFPEDEATRLLAAFRRLARHGVIVNDLRRDWIPWGFVTLVGWATLRQRMFRHDAPLSVLRGFTAAELRELARGAGAAKVEVRRRWPYRLALQFPGAAS